MSKPAPFPSHELLTPREREVLQKVATMPVPAGIAPVPRAPPLTACEQETLERLTAALQRKDSKKE